MTDKLAELENKYEELSARVSDPDLIADQPGWRAAMRERARIEPVVLKFRELKAAESERDENRAMLGETLDDDFRQLVKDEFARNKREADRLAAELKILLLPVDPNDEKNVVMEIRGGVGGDEAALFAAALYRMYCQYAAGRRWKTELMSANETEGGGIKEVVFMVYGKGAYSRLKYESGVHRVQRVPVTESNGRVHTSAVTVAVLPEAEDVEVNLDMNDVRVDVFRSSGHGGQSVNTTDSAVRITHAPTGIVVSMQDEKSQLKNKEKGLKILRAKLYDLELAKRRGSESAERKSQVGSGDRSERIRTYNFPQGRVTDHRIGLTLYRLEAALGGDLDEIIDTLITTDQARRLSASETRS
ncbi:MAG: peptide chain release factor 1 [Clostridiales bacterium]|nr:peptide chain release factor 1 [Clostridiales bacterium]